MSASSSSGVTQWCLSRNEAFSRVILVFWRLSNGCSSALNARPPQTRYSRTTMKTASTVFHFITEWSAVAMPSQLASMLATTLAEREEMDRRGSGQWPLALGSQPMGFCMVATLAWTRLDFAMPGWTFLGGTKLVWTATRKEWEEVLFTLVLEDSKTETAILYQVRINRLFLAQGPESGECEDRLRDEKKKFFF